jgi:predicted AAA+ superfamily ATPase
MLRSYLDDVARVDILVVAGTANRRDPVRVNRLLAAYARHIATSASLATLAADTAARDATAITADTAREYLATLQRIMVVEEQPSWAAQLRSRDVVRKAAVRHFADPSLAIAALGASTERLLADLNTLGLLFESLVIRDLRVYTQPLDGDVLHYRDSSGQEADAIIQLRDGRWAAIEIKLGASAVDAAAASLHRLIAKTDLTKTGKPSALIVITGGKYAYTRPDGIHVVPLGTLQP